MRTGKSAIRSVNFIFLRAIPFRLTPNPSIKNGTFTIDGVTSHIPENENKGHDTLHGGFVGYDQQNWTVAAVTPSSITFTFFDAAQSGFPGDVLNVATYTLTDDAAWTSRLISIPVTGPTPIMLANHIYWNLGAFTDAESQLILNDTLYMPYAKRIIDIDGIEVPTGQINTTANTAYDFTVAPGKEIGRDMFSLHNSCGTGCVGYDNAFILDDRPHYGDLSDPTLGGPAHVQPQHRHPAVAREQPAGSADLRLLRPERHDSRQAEPAAYARQDDVRGEVRVSCH